MQIKEVEIGVRYDVDCCPIKNGLGVLLMILKDVEFNRPLFYLIVPGSIFGISGLVMEVKFLQEFLMGRGLNFGPAFLMVLLVVGSFLALVGILMHSVSTTLNDARPA